METVESFSSTECLLCLAEDRLSFMHKKDQGNELQLRESGAMRTSAEPPCATKESTIHSFTMSE